MQVMRHEGKIKQIKLHFLHSNKSVSAPTKPTKLPSKMTQISVSDLVPLTFLI